MKPKKIILGLYIGIIALSSLGLSFSVAWYASSMKLQINTVNIEIKAERDLKICTVPNFDNAKDHLGYDELDSVSSFTPVTSAYSYRWMNTKEGMPSFYDDTFNAYMISIQYRNNVRNTHL